MIEYLGRVPCVCACHDRQCVGSDRCDRRHIGGDAAGSARIVGVENEHARRRRIAVRFVIGGFSSPLIDPMYDARRVDAPAYPVGSAAATGAMIGGLVADSARKKLTKRFVDYDNNQIKRLV